MRRTTTLNTDGIPKPTRANKASGKSRQTVKAQLGLEHDVSLKVSLDVELRSLALAGAALLQDRLAVSLVGVLVGRLGSDARLVVRVEAHHHGAVLERVHLAGHLTDLGLRLRVVHDALDLLVGRDAVVVCGAVGAGAGTRRRKRLEY